MVKKIKGPVGSSKVKEQWREVYDKIAKMRETIQAPVDVDGAIATFDNSIDPKLARFQTLIGILLSAQTKDATTARVVENLKANGLTPQRMAEISLKDLSEEIHGVRFQNNKAKHIKETAQILLEKYDGDVPNDFKTIVSLPGVGLKMAHMFLQVCYGSVEGIAVDTHVHRVANRLGWAKSKKPDDTMEQLQDLLPRELWDQANTILVGFGQVICTKKNPKCEECEVKNLCEFYNAKKRK
ncbi:unnamed protein product [Blepharisma stoltei]|uniref:Endonuclease III homolog n=1 Tax=Blepharisma stoltei TaxID=1481888 RepID=A0AAU9IR97_9CILI|nr:unnamed protein product [Blepharisma stoltei]